jgi:thymidylate kinase
VVLDRSIISTYAYGISTVNNLGLLGLVKDYDPLIVFFEKVYDSSKLPSDYERIKERYLRALKEIRPWLHIPYIITTAETFLNRVNSLEKLVKLFENKDLP